MEKQTVKEGSLREFLAHPPTIKRVGISFSGLSLQDKKEMHEKIGKVFKKDKILPFIVEKETMFYDEDLYDGDVFEYFHDFICEMSDEKFEEEMKILKECYNTNGEQFYRELRKCIREKNITPESTSDEVIKNNLSWIPVFFQLKFKSNDKRSKPLLPLNINSKVKSYLGPIGDFIANYSSRQIIVVNDEMLEDMNFKRFIIALCQIMAGNYFEHSTYYEPIGIIVRNHEAYLFFGGLRLRILGKLDLRESKNVIFIVMILLNQCNCGEGNSIYFRDLHLERNIPHEHQR